MRGESVTRETFLSSETILYAIVDVIGFLNLLNKSTKTGQLRTVLEARTLKSTWY